MQTTAITITTHFLSVPDCNVACRVCYRPLPPSPTQLPTDTH
ncbi:hypothetical protein TSMEX_003207 [Taenia solium]|eukprot:TsM_000369600 transcript=TsM_000369600 gene=TsM_000369600